MSRCSSLTGRALTRQAAWCAVVLLALSAAAFARSPASVEGTAEWGRLCDLWNVMIDHSAGAVYSAERFQQLAPDLDRADTDLTALIDQKRLSSEDGEALRRLFHARYEYIHDHFYLAQSRFDRPAFEAVQQTSQWVVELHLSLLREQYRAAKPDAKVVRTCEDGLASELTFQRQCTALSEKIAQQRKQLAEKEQQHQKVDWKAVDVDCERRQAALVAAYQRGRTRPDRAVRRLMPYVLSLTHPCPAAPAGNRAASE